MNNVPPPPQDEKRFTDLESRAGRGGKGMGTGRHHTRPCCYFSCIEQTLPCLQTLQTLPCCAPDTPCCAFYSHLLLEERHDSSFTLTILTEEAAQSSPGLLALLVSAIFSTAFFATWMAYWKSSVPISLHQVPGGRDVGNCQM